MKPGGWYLVISNHRTWADILVLQKVFNHRIPFLKFFLKQQLIWLPVAGQVRWAMDNISPQPDVSFWDFVSGKVSHVTVRVEQLPIPDEFLHNQYATDPLVQKNFQDWVNQLWEKKDQKIKEMISK